MTQMLHWTKHTATYFENVNKAIKPFPALQVMASTCHLSMHASGFTCMSDHAWPSISGLLA